MTTPVASGLFLREGSSDEPLAEIVEELFARRGVALRLTAPDFSRLSAPPVTTRDKVREGLALSDGPIDVIVVHRDADAVGRDRRLKEITDALVEHDVRAHLVPVIPVRTLEAWLLLDEAALRRVAGNPNGKVRLDLPKAHEAERDADPKTTLRNALRNAADESARRRQQEVERRFSARRERLLSDLDLDGRVHELSSWQHLVAAVDEVVDQLSEMR